MAASDKAQQVLVTGAAGKTGQLVLKRLLNLPDKFAARALVHTDKSAQKLQSNTGLSADAAFTADITDESLSGLTAAMEGVDALVISTSAKPQLVVSSLPKSIWNKIRGASAMPDFYYNQTPEQVDWIGQKHQIDAAAKAGVKKVVLISSMGGTKDKDYMLNKMGNGNILFWKRKAEEYLMQVKGIDYTIIHPGGLTDDKGGEREVLMGVDDELMEGENRRIPRADVAELAVQSLYLPEASNRSIDVVSKPPPGSTDFRQLLDSMQGNCNYSLHQAA